MSEWIELDKAPENTKLLCYCPYYEPHYFVGSFHWQESEDRVLVSSTKKREVYEKTTLRERVWDAENWSATHCMILPEPPPSNQDDKTPEK